MDFKLNKSNLNFRVYTASSIPATGTENDICIVSEVSMSNWIMSPDKPSGIPRSDGDVWIQYSVTGDTFNALKQNTMMIATISAWQYADGAWAYVEVVSYQNGKWVEWYEFLFKNGNQYEDLTGGWIKSSASTQANATVTVGNTIIISSNFTSAAVVACTKNKIDLADYSAVMVKVSSIVPYSEQYTPSMRVQIHNSMNYDDYSAAQFFSEPGEYLIPLDGISSGYPSVTVYCATIEVSEIALVR